MYLNFSSHLVFGLPLFLLPSVIPSNLAWYDCLSQNTGAQFVLGIDPELWPMYKHIEFENLLALGDLQGDTKVY